MSEEINHNNNIHGIWRISGSNKQVSGVLYPNEKLLVVNGDLRSEADLPIQKYKDENGKTFKTMGFGGGSKRLEESKNNVIYGLSNNKKEITLFYESDTSGTKMLGSGFLFDESKWGITRYILGKHIEIQEVFYKAIFNIENLNILANKNILEGSYNFPPKEKLEGKFSITKQEDQLFFYNGIVGTIKFSRNSNFNGKIFIEPTYRLEINSESGFTLGNIEGIIARIYNLFLLLCEENPIIRNISLRTTQLYKTNEGTKEYPHKIDYHILNNRFAKKEKITMFPGLEYKKVTLYDQDIKNINVFNGIQNFSDKFDELVDPLSYYFATISNSGISINTAFLNLVFGLEGFHRIVFGTKVATEVEITETLKKIQNFIDSLKLQNNISQLFTNSLSGAKHNELSAKNKLREIKIKLNIDDSTITETEIIKSLNQRDLLVHIKKGSITTVDVKELHPLTIKLYKFLKTSILSYMGFNQQEIIST